MRAPTAPDPRGEALGRFAVGLEEGGALLDLDLIEVQHVPGHGKTTAAKAGIGATSAARLAAEPPGRNRGQEPRVVEVEQHLHARPSEFPDAVGDVLRGVVAGSAVAVVRQLADEATGSSRRPRWTWAGTPR